MPGWRIGAGGRRRIAFAALFIADIVLTAMFMLTYLQAVKLTTPVRDRQIGSPTDLAYRDVTLQTVDGLTLAGWYVPGTRAEAIVLVHGIHANRAYLLPQARILAAAGYGLLLIDLRGHGYSEGQMLTYGYDEALDVQAAVDYLSALPEVRRVGVIGHSLGGAAVVRAAARDERIEALVVQSSYSSLQRAIEDGFDNFAWLPRWPFAPLVVALAQLRTGLRAREVDSAHDLATMSPRPVLIIHGADDTLFPVQHAYRMYAAAQAPKTLWVVHGVPHVNPIAGHEDEYKEKILAFFEDALK